MLSLKVQDVKVSNSDTICFNKISRSHSVSLPFSLSLSFSLQRALFIFPFSDRLARYARASLSQEI